MVHSNIYIDNTLHTSKKEVPIKTTSHLTASRTDIILLMRSNSTLNYYIIQYITGTLKLLFVFFVLALYW